MSLENHMLIKDTEIICSFCYQCKRLDFLEALFMVISTGFSLPCCLDKVMKIEHLNF